MNTGARRRLVVTVTGLLLAASLVTGVFSVVTLFDSLHRYVELFSHFRLQYLVAAVLLAAALPAARQHRAAAAMVAIVVLNAVYVLPWYGLGRPAHATPASTLTLLLANVRVDNSEFDGLLRLIEAEKPDVIVVQELTPAWAEALQPLRSEWRYGDAIARTDPFGIGLFSRVPVDATDRIDSPPLGLPTLVATVTPGDRPVTIVATHPMNPISAGGAVARNHQLDSIAALVGAREADVLIGDLNTSVWSRTYRRLQTETGMNNARRGYGVLPSWPTFLPVAMIPLDHCLVAPGIVVLDARTGDDIGSDHLPLIVTLGFP